MEKQLYDKLLFRVVEQFFKEIEAPITSASLKNSLLSHPDYTSLAALSDICEEYQIEHLAIDISFEKLQENGFPVLTHIVEDRRGLFAIVENIDTEMITYYHPQRKKVKETLDKFQEKWSKVAFYALPDNSSGEENYKRKHIIEVLLKFRLPVFILYLIVLIGYSLYTLQPIVNVAFTYLLFVKFVGLFFCVNLVLHSLGASTNLSDQVCKMGKHTSCEDVLNSPAAKLFNFLSMSDIGLVYFTGGLLAMFISLYTKTTQAVTICLLIIATCTVPYIIFSISYQAFKIKKWCPLCLSVMSILAVECLLLFIFNGMLNHYIPPVSIICYIFFSFVFVTCLWSYLKPIIINLKEGTQYKYAYYRLKKNPLIYNAHLNSTPSTDMQFSENDIIIGDSDAGLTVTAVMNTHCGPCASMHKKIMKILSKNKGKVKLVLRFMIPNGREDEAKHLLELYYSQGSQVFEKALTEWFETKDSNALKRNYPINQQPTSVTDTLEQHSKWCSLQLVTYTPTLFLNDKRMKVEYNADDLEWLIRNILYA